MHTRAHKSQHRASLLKQITLHVFAPNVRVRARIIMKIYVMVNIYTDSLSLKFYDDPFIGCREIAETRSSMQIWHF